jgi:hypothetical protein
MIKSTHLDTVKHKSPGWKRQKTVPVVAGSVTISFMKN